MPLLRPEENFTREPRSPRFLYYMLSTIVQNPPLVKGNLLETCFCSHLYMFYIYNIYGKGRLVK